MQNLAWTNFEDFFLKEKQKNNQDLYKIINNVHDSQKHSFLFA